MGNSNFEKNLFITYLDEVKAYALGKYLFTYIVSISMKKSYYINNIEPKWKKLREKYSIPEGICLHFTDIKALLNKSYYHRQIKERNLDLEKVFCKDNILDKDKLYNFYLDIIDIIDESDFDILVTGIRQEKGVDLKKREDQLKTSWNILFKNHLDNLVELMTFKSNNNKNKKPYLTKLRFDGDRDLESRDDIEYAYADVISNGSLRFKTEHCRNCLDSLKFVGKDEVGLSNEIAHAGNEILDFIALYAAKYYSKDKMIDDYINFKGVSEEVAKQYVDKNIKIYIDDKNIYPHKAIEKKIYKNKAFLVNNI